MTAMRPALVSRVTVLAAVLLAGSCGPTPVGQPTTGPAPGAPAPPDLLARPAGFQLWDYERLGPRPGSLFGPGGTVSGRVKVIERWPQYFNLLMVPREEYNRVRVGMAYDEVRNIVGDVLLPFRFDPDSEYDLCCVQKARIALFRFRGGTLVHKDQQGIE